MIEELIIAFNSKSKQLSWFDYITKISSQQNEEVEIVSKPKSVTSSTMPPQVYFTLHPFKNALEFRPCPLRYTLLYTPLRML